MTDEHLELFRRRSPAGREAAGELHLRLGRLRRLLPQALGKMPRHRLDKAAVPLRQGLQGGGRLVACRHAHRGIGAVESRQHRLGLRAHHEAVNRAAVGGRVVRVVEVVLIVRRMLGLLDDEILEGFAPGRVVQLAAHRENRVAEFLGAETPPVRPPMIGIARVDRGVGLIMTRPTPIRFARDDKPHERLHRLIRIIAQGRGEVVEQLRMGR